MGSLLQSGQKYAKKALKEQLKKETKSLKSNKSRKQPLGDKDDPVDGIVRLTASFVGTVSEAYQYRKEKKQLAEEAAAEEKKPAPQENGLAPPQGPQRGESSRSQSQNGEQGNRASASSEEEGRNAEAAGDFSEAAWQLDDARRNSLEEDGRKPSNTKEGETAEDKAEEEKNKKKKAVDFAKDFIERHPLDPATASTRSPIELPVVMPQRRPKNRGRGFVRAYSPVLGSAGIQQPEFIDFMDTFNRASLPSEWIQAFDLVSMAGMAAPEPIALLIDAAVAAAVEAATEAQSRYRSGRFMDKVNSEYFMPRGLVAMVVTWKAWGEQPDEALNTMESNGEFGQPSPGSQPPLTGGVSFDGEAPGVQSGVAPAVGFAQGWKDVVSRKATPREVQTRLGEHMQHRMKRYNGVFECPESAPLVFPSVEEDHAASVLKKNGKKMNGFDRGEQWLNGFRDRRAQVKLANKTPDSTVATPAAAGRKHEFRSRYADPSHPAASGDIVAFATGGKWSTRGKVKPQDVQQEDEEEISSDEERANQKWEKKKEKEQMKRREKARKRAEKEKKGGSQLSNLLRTDVLYLVIMNVPTAAEQAAAATMKQQAEDEAQDQDVGEERADGPSGVRQQENEVASTYSHSWDNSRYGAGQYDTPRAGGDSRYNPFVTDEYEPAPPYEAVQQQAELHLQPQQSQFGSNNPYRRAAQGMSSRDGQSAH